MGQSNIQEERKIEFQQMCNKQNYQGISKIFENIYSLEMPRPENSAIKKAA